MSESGLLNRDSREVMRALGLNCGYAVGCLGVAYVGDGGGVEDWRHTDRDREEALWNRSPLCVLLEAES